MASYYVYIIQSQKDNTLYKGYSTDCLKRLNEHNLGLSRYTSKGRPWKLIYAELCKSKADALRRERTLKRANKDYIQWLLKQFSNLITN